MHLAQLKLRNFRNYGRLDLVLNPGFHLFLGGNAQGKSNLLEAIYLLATLRSFRGHPNSQLVRENSSGWFVGATVESEGTQQVKVFWSTTQRRIQWNHRTIRRAAEYLGCFRAVIFSSEDLQLVKGSGRFRRRYLDLVLSQTAPGYLQTLLAYTAAVRSRNAVLKQSPLDRLTLESFTAEVAQLGNQLMQLRKKELPTIGRLAAKAHERLVPKGEVFLLEYQPNVEEDLAVALAKTSERDITMRMTLRGPHRDDLNLLLDEHPAAQFGSEGQKRTIAIALKIAQAEYLESIHGKHPVLLLDDVMGELDAARRSALIPLLHEVRQTGGQVFMTCTEENWPVELGEPVHRWFIQQGTARPGSAAFDI